MHSSDEDTEESHTNSYAKIQVIIIHKEVEKLENETRCLAETIEIIVAKEWIK